ncbi:MAG: ABC transporter ATP-binding protein [Turicibacter sp.]|nr:ABC transporter ATP-binding protein [Turicibacter sp.]
MEQPTALLELKDFKVHFHASHEKTTVVKGVNLKIQPGEILGLVGESGCGKSVMSQSLMRLLEYSADVSYEGNILFDGQDILRMNPQELRKVRGNEIAMIFQDPMVSLNPVFTIGNQIEEVLKEHTRLSKKERKSRVLELLGLMEISEPARVSKQYPHELSGGMQQRAMIAIALACEPKLLIADEPTTALDVTTQAQIMKLLQKLNLELGMAILFITHDLGLVYESCHRAEVMYLGQTVESAPGRDLFELPKHPYTKGLAASIPSLTGARKEKLPVIPGIVPSLKENLGGCAFAKRCPYATEKCFQQIPPVFSIGEGRAIKCHYDIDQGVSLL